jgi:hypothetical protein
MQFYRAIKNNGLKVRKEEGKTMALTKEKLNEIVAASDFDQLIGEVENIWFDCKGQPYSIKNDAGKRELAKDISSFANVQGGVILIGIKTKHSTTHFGDEIEELRPFAQSLVNTSQYKDIIRAWVYPELEGTEVEWIPTKSDSEKGIIAIKIPLQKESLKPFLIVKTLDENKRVETVFGYAERKSDNSQSLTVIDLQRALRSGFNYENLLKEKLDVIEILLRQKTEQNHANAENKTYTEKNGARIEKALTYEDIGKKRNIILSAYPNQPGELKTIFLTTDGSIRKHLENPPILRHGGWSLETLDQARIVRGEMIRVTNGDVKVIDLYRDGSLIFAGLADNNFLAWGDSPLKQKINAVAIVEIIYSFVNFYKLVLKDFKELPKEVIFGVQFRNMHLDGIKNYLVPYKLGSIPHIFDDEKQDAPDNNGSFAKSFLAQDYDVAIIAYEILKEVYLWFCLEEDKIPYVKSENGLKMVEADAIKNIR